MRMSRVMRWSALAATGAIVFQSAGCTALELLQTIFLGATTAFTFVIFRNV